MKDAGHLTELLDVRESCLIQWTDQRQGIKHSQKLHQTPVHLPVSISIILSLPTRHQTQYLDCESTDQGFKRLIAVSEDN